jgi:uncharacterized membrane protein
MKNEEHPVFIKFLSFGAVTGLFVGLFTDNMGLWSALGIAIGAALGYQKIEEK